jgi:hypothetical protein
MDITMIRKLLSLLYIIVFISPLLSSVWVSAFEIKSQYAVISYANDDMLQTLNSRLFISRFKYLIKEKRPMTVEEEVMGKIDLITVKVEEILEMFPPNLQYTLSLCENMDQVKDNFVTLHQREWKRPGFYSPINDTIYLSARHAKINVVAHEVGHVVVEKYFKVRPPVKIHEILAQFAEQHITD